MRDFGHFPWCIFDLLRFYYVIILLLLYIALRSCTINGNRTGPSFSIQSSSLYIILLFCTVASHSREILDFPYVTIDNGRE